MAKNGYTPEQHVERITVDPKTGVRHDQAGNPIIAAPSGWNDVMHYSDTGKPMLFRDVFPALAMRYADVYPGPANVHINAALSEMAVSYELESEMFIAGEVAPVHTVTHRSNSYFAITRDDVTRNYGDQLQKGVGAVANEVEQGFSTATYNTVQYGLRTFLPDVTVANEDEALMLTTRNAEFLTDVLDFGWDRRITTNMFNATTFAAALATFTTASGGGANVSAATQANGYIRNAINYGRIRFMNANNGRPPTHMVMGANTAQLISASAEVAAQVVYDLGGKYTMDGGWPGPNYGLPPNLQGLKVVVAAIPTNSAKKGQTGSFAQLLDTQIGLFRIEQPSRQTRNCCTTFRFGGVQVKSYRDEARAGVYTEVIMDQDEKITNVYGGYLITATNS